MRNILTCVKHPTKPANKMCWGCKKGFCKYCELFYDGEHYYCDECKPQKTSKMIRFDIKNYEKKA
jgi:hypothetical protein